MVVDANSTKLLREIDWWSISASSPERMSSRINANQHRITHDPAKDLETLLKSFYNKIRKDLPPVLFVPLPEPSLLVILATITTVITIIILVVLFLKPCVKYGIRKYKRKPDGQSVSYAVSYERPKLTGRRRTTESDAERGDPSTQRFVKRIPKVTTTRSTATAIVNHPSSTDWDSSAELTNYPQPRSTHPAVASTAAVAASAKPGCEDESVHSRSKFAVNDNYELPPDSYPSIQPLAPPPWASVSSTRSVNAVKPDYARPINSPPT